MTEAARTLADLTADSIEDFLCEGHCKNPGMCDGTETTWCGRKAQAIAALARSPLPGTREEVARDVPHEMLVAAMRAFEPLSSVLRYREKDKWHSCDMMAMRDAIKAVLALAALPPAPMPERDGMREALEKITRTPGMPFPDPGAHSWQAWGRAVYRAFSDIQGIARAALASHDDKAIAVSRVNEEPHERTNAQN